MLCRYARRRALCVGSERQTREHRQRLECTSWSRHGTSTVAIRPPPRESHPCSTASTPISASPQQVGCGTRSTGCGNVNAVLVERARRAREVVDVLEEVRPTSGSSDRQRNRHCTPFLDVRPTGDRPHNGEREEGEPCNFDVICHVWCKLSEEGARGPRSSVHAVCELRPLREQREPVMCRTPFERVGRRSDV